MDRSQQRLLWVIRHGKAKNSAPSDHARPLSKRGVRQAEDWLQALPNYLGNDVSAERPWIVSSTAVRAAGTSTLVASGFGLAETDVIFTDDLYLAGAEGILDVVRGLPDVRFAIVVGHNPGLSDFVSLLAGAADVEALGTFGTARFSLSGPWHDLAFGQSTTRAL